MASVQYEEATRLYPGTDKPAVNELNLSIADGELLVLVGPSGSGKSTALRMLAGLEPLDEGKIMIGGKDVSAVRPRDRDIAMVFQSYALYPQLDVAANMGFALKQQGVPKEERRQRVLEAAEIDGTSLINQLRSVILPIAAPGIAATALLCVIFAWNEYFYAIQLNFAGASTMPQWVIGNVSTRGNFLAKLSAASIIACLPVVLAGWAAQKRMIRGLSMGAIK